MSTKLKNDRKNQLVPYALLGLSLVLLLFYMFKSVGLKKRLVVLEENKTRQLKVTKQQKELFRIDSLLFTGQYDEAIHAYNSSFANKDFDDVSAIELRIKAAERFLKIDTGQHQNLEVFALRDSLDSIRAKSSALPSEIRSYDSLYFALEKTKVQLANMRNKLRNKAIGEYLTFSNTKGSQMHYVGQVKNGKANGFGVALLNTGSRYQGAWRNNQRHGDGSFYWADGQYYIGSYSNDLRNGQGTYYWPNGEKYVGQWKDDKRNGEGVFYGKDGAIITSGIWKNDKLADKNQARKSRK